MTSPQPPLSPESAKLIRDLIAMWDEDDESGMFKYDSYAEWKSAADEKRAALEERFRELERELARMREQHALCYEASRNIGPAAFYEFNRYVNERSEAINAKYAAPTERDG